MESSILFQYSVYSQGSRNFLKKLIPIKNSKLMIFFLVQQLMTWLWRVSLVSIRAKNKIWRVREIKTIFWRTGIFQMRNKLKRRINWFCSFWITSKAIYKRKKGEVEKQKNKSKKINQKKENKKKDKRKRKKDSKQFKETSILL